MSLPGRSSHRMSEEEKMKFLMSLDPHIVEEALKRQVQASKNEVGNGLPRSTSVEHGPLYTTPSIIGSHTVMSTHEVGNTINMQSQMNAALFVAENILHHPATIRKVSVNQGMPTKTGMFSKKKAAEPSLVFTFSANDLQEADENDGMDNRSIHSQSTIRSPYQKLEHQKSGGMNPSPSNNSLGVYQGQDRMDSGSVASYRSAGATTHVSSTQEIIEQKLEKKQRFVDFLTMVLSISYGIFVVMISICAYCSDLLLANSYEYNNTEIWNLLLSCVGIILLVWLMVDIRGYIHTINKMGKGSSFYDNLKLVEGLDGELHIELPMNQGKKKNVPEYYGFTTGRHSGSFFLKIGAALFCFGHLIHMGLNFVKHIYAMTGDDVRVEKYCGQREGLAYDIIYPIFSLIQLYFIFKYGNVVVNKNKWLARFTFMHCLSSSLAFWMNTLIDETLDAIVKKYFVKKVSNCYDSDYNFTSTPPMTSLGSTLATTTEDEDLFKQPISSFASYELAPCNKTQTDMANNVICVIETRAMCNNGENADDLFSVAPWLYPFSIEFSILVVAIWYILWSSIGKIHEHKDEMEFLPSITPQGSMENLHRTEGHKQALILFADCSSSNMGMFLGVVLMVAVIVCSLVVIVKEGDCDPSTAILMGNTLKSGVLVILIIASIYAYYVVVQFDVNPDPISFLDDMLLFLCLPSFFLYSLISLGPTILTTFEPDFFVVNVLTLVQVLIQTPMIVDGLRRCSNSIDAQRKMRGRNVITFLIVANLAVYVMETLMIKSYDYQKLKIEFYGPDAWTVLSHATLPICIFYRFHSAVALVDIWNSAYKAPEHHSL